MIKTIDQAKALLRATPKGKLDLLTSITLESDDDEIMRFCENYRWVLHIRERRETQKEMDRVKARQRDSEVQSQERNDELDRNNDQKGEVNEDRKD